jgi:hypothetical protein
MDLYEDADGNLIYMADDGEWYYYDDYAAMYGDTEGIYDTGSYADYYSDGSADLAPAYAPQGQTLWEELTDPQRWWDAVHEGIIDPNNPDSVVGFAKEYGPTVAGLASYFV